MALIKAKKEKHAASLDTIDAWNKFETIVMKWNKISAKVINAWFSIQMRNGVACKDKWGAIVRDFKKIYDYKLETWNNQNYESLNTIEKTAQGLPKTFVWGLYEMVREFLGTRPTFNPLHMWDLIDDVDGNYKPFGLTPNDSINLNENLINANYEAIQNVNVEEKTNTNDGWMFEPTLVTTLPLHSAVANNFTKLMHDISGDSIDPIHSEITAPLPTPSNATTLLPTQPQVMPCTNPSSNPPTPISINRNSNIAKIRNGHSTRSTRVKRTCYFADKNMAKTTKKGSKMLVDLIDRINATSVLLEEKWIEIHDKLVEKQLEYFKVRDEAANHT